MPIVHIHPSHIQSQRCTVAEIAITCIQGGSLQTTHDNPRALAAWQQGFDDSYYSDCPPEPPASLSVDLLPFWQDGVSWAEEATQADRDAVWFASHAKYDAEYDLYYHGGEIRD